MQIIIIRAFSFDSLKKIVNFEPDYNKIAIIWKTLKRSGLDVSDKEIVFSQSIKAGKRIYYLDVKKNRKDEMFLAITESKKIVTGEGDESQVSFEKHKIFLYKEDFEKFMNGLQQAIGFIQEQQGCFMRRNDNEEQPDNVQPAEEQKEKDSPLDGEIKIDIDF